jgi:peptidoglycan lytic transglycosylase G
MAGNDVPGEEFLPGFGRPEEDWGDEDRRPPRRGRGRPMREDRYPEDRYAPDRYDDRDHGGGRDFGGRDYDGRDDDDHDDGGRGRKGRKRGGARRLAPWIALLVLVVFLGAVGGGGLYAYHYVQAKDHPPDYAGSGTGPQVMVQVVSGDTATSLAPKLVSDGVVESTRAFILAAESGSGSLEAGYYLMNRRMRASLAYAYLANPKNLVQDVVTIPEGYRAADAVKVLAAKTHIPVADFQSVLKSPGKLGLPSYADGKPEGYLFPATYAIEPHQTALQILQGMVSRFDQEAALVSLPTSLSVHAHGGTVHLTTGQVMIAASLIQAEAGRDQDMAQIAEVVYNRLAIGMPLKFDSTVFYGLGKYGTSASNTEIATPGPYNTYLNTGLTPTPIDSPGDAAIRAALHPATGDLLYFRGCPSGVTVFSPTQVPPTSSC